MSQNNVFGDIYHIIWFLPSGRAVGEVRNYACGLSRHRRIGISMGDDVLRRMGRQFLMTEWATSGPKIHVSAAFMAIPRSLREAGIWHEVGHIHYGHGDLQRHNPAELSISSMMATDRETLKAMDAAADRFAILQSGKAALKGFLEYLLRARPSAIRGGWNGIERRELEARIASIGIR